MARVSKRAMILQEYQKVYDTMRADFQGMGAGTGNRYSGDHEKDFRCISVIRLRVATDGCRNYSLIEQLVA